MVGCLRCGVRSPFRPPPMPTTTTFTDQPCPSKGKLCGGQPTPFKQLLSTFARLQAAFRFEELSRDRSNIMVIKLDAGNDQMTRIAEESL